MNKFRDMLGLPHMMVHDNKGKSGGVALFWRRGINVTVRWMGRMHIDAIVEEEDGYKWRLTGIYGESHTDKKVETWRLFFALYITKSSFRGSVLVILMRYCSAMRNKEELPEPIDLCKISDMH